MDYDELIFVGASTIYASRTTARESETTMDEAIIEAEKLWLRVLNNRDRKREP
jgi:hypothetical protein